MLRILMRSTTCGIRPGFPGLFLTLGYVPTRYSAVRRSCILTQARKFIIFQILISQIIYQISIYQIFRNDKLELIGKWLMLNGKCVRTLVRTLPLDLHILGTPPAFILSQDQTLQKCKDFCAAWACLLAELTTLLPLLACYVVRNSVAHLRYWNTARCATRFFLVSCSSTKLCCWVCYFLRSLKLKWTPIFQSGARLLGPDVDLHYSIFNELVPY